MNQTTDNWKVFLQKKKKKKKKKERKKIKERKKKTRIIMTLLNSVLTETLNLTRQATTQLLLMNYYIAQYIKGTSEIIERRILQPCSSSVYM